MSILQRFKSKIIGETTTSLKIPELVTLKKTDKKPSMNKHNNKYIKPEPNRGISIRTLREQEEYIKSAEYQNLLNDIEYLNERRKTKHIIEREHKRLRHKTRIYDMPTYQLEKELEILKHKDHELKSKPDSIPLKRRYDPAILDKIPCITLEGKIIHRT